jgi:exodeoxyribonuclease VII large subunit
VPVRAELLATIAELNARRRGAILRFSHRLRSDLRALARALPGGEAIIASPRQRLDRASETLAQRMRGALDQRALRTAGLARQLARHSPRAHLAGLRERLRGLSGRLARTRPLLIERPRGSADAVSRTFVREAALLAKRHGEQTAALARLAARMTRAYDERLQSRRAQLFSAGQLLGAMSYRGVLSRGFALVRDETQRPVWRAEDMRQAQRLEIEFADGKIGAIAGGRVGPPLTPPALLPRRRTKPDKDAEGQGSLF